MFDDLLLVNDPCVRLLSGITQLEYIPRRALVSMPFPSSLSLTTPITLKSGWRWYKLEVTDDTAFFSEEYQDTANGPLYSTSVGGFYPKDDIATVAMLERMASAYFLVRAQDYQGQWRIIGNMNETLKLTKRSFQSTTPSNQTGFMLEFAGTFIRPALFDNRP